MRLEMINGIIDKTLCEVYKYLFHNFTKTECETISNELITIVHHSPKQYGELRDECTYDDIQLLDMILMDYLIGGS